MYLGLISAECCSRKAEMPCTVKYASLHCRGKLCLVTEHDQYTSKAPRLIRFCAATKYLLTYFRFFATEFGTLKYVVSGKCTFCLLCAIKTQLYGFAFSFWPQYFETEDIYK